MKKSSDVLKLRKVARIHDRATGQYLDRIEFILPSGTKKRIELSPSIVADARAFKKHLLDAGAILPAKRTSLVALLEATAASVCKLEFTYAAQTGWTKTGKVFVRPDKVVGKQGASILGFRRSSPADTRGMIKRSGSVSSWKSSVGESAGSSSILMFAISAALGSALLNIAGKSSFGFCLFSESRTGKTLATLAAGSVVGFGTTGQMLDWNITDARLQELLPEINDCLVPIDDLMSMKGSDREKYTRVKNSAYIVALGSGTGRHSSFSQKSAENWRTIVLTSNEYSIRDLAARLRVEREPGSTVRLIDVPATFDGASDIFDRINASNARLPWDQWFELCGKHQGYLFEKFVGMVIARKKTVRKLISQYMKTFVEHVGEEDDGNFARDIAGKFGLVYAAGEIGIQFGLLPWDSDDLSDAISKCYFGARELIPDRGVTLRDGKSVLLSYLEKLPDKKKITSLNADSLEGFKETLPQYHRYLVKRDKFNSLFSSINQAKIVTEWLIANSHVTLAKASAGSDKLKEQHIWPDRKRYRSVEIHRPRGKVD